MPDTIRVAAMDLGTVTCRLGVADVVDGNITAFEKHSTIVNFGEGVASTGRISAKALERAILCLQNYLSIAREQKADVGAFVLTSASRDANNLDGFLELCKALGLAPQIIEGEVEAELSFLGAAQNFPAEHIMVADNGGGSTELSEGTLGEQALQLAWVYSANVGCRRVRDLYLFEEGPASKDQLAAAHEFCAKRFADALATRLELGELPERLVVTGGTATSLVAISQELIPYDPKRVHLSELSLSAVEALEEKLAVLSVAERAELKGLQAKRAPVILAGTVAIVELMRAVGVSTITVSESDLLQGLALRIAEAASMTATGDSKGDAGWLPQLSALLR